jgi:capsid protein
VRVLKQGAMNPALFTRIRTAARLGVQAVKSIFAHYEGARNYPHRSWVPGGLQSARLDYTPRDRRELQRKSRYWERNTAIVQRLVYLFEQYTVGVGIGFYAASSDPEWNARARERWIEWEPTGDFLSDRGFNLLQNLAARSLMVDGENFFVLTHDDDGEPQVQMIEADRCATPPDRQKEEGISIIDGVAIDADGRPTGYWFGEDIPGSPGQRTWRLVPKEFVVHIFEPSRPGDYRGRPMLHAVLNDIHDLDDLQIMESKAARDGAEITNVIKNQSGTADVGEYLAAAGTPPGSMTQEQKRTYYENTIGGRTFFLQQDDDISQLKVERPSGSTREYWILLEQKICAGVGIPRQLVYSESLQGTVQRSVLDLAAAWFRIRSAVFVRGFARIYQFVLEHSIATNRNGLADPPADWKRFTWRPPRTPNVDVGRNSYAMLKELAAGTTNYTRIFAELGLDRVEELTRKADDVVLIQKLAAERGILPEDIAAQNLADQPVELGTNQEEETAPP